MRANQKPAQRTTQTDTAAAIDRPINSNNKQTNKKKIEKIRELKIAVRIFTTRKVFRVQKPEQSCVLQCVHKEMQPQ